MVVTPGATVADTAFSTSRTMCPLRRIFSISAGDLHTIMLDHPKHRGGHFLHRLVAIYLAQTALAAIVVHQRRGLFLVSFQGLRKNACCIVLSHHHQGTL